MTKKQSGAVRARRLSSIVSFFSGCGGMDLGFLGGFSYRGSSYQKLPYKILRAYDFSAKAVQTYKQNVAPHAEVCDLGKANVGEMPSADLLLGGFPCQEFSVCGPRKGLESERGQLYKAMIRYAKEHKPKLIVGENVANILYINNGWDFSVIKRDFSRAGYRCVTWKVNAADYGIPQNRHRVFVIFIRKDLATDPALPTPTHLECARSAAWAIGDLVSVNDETIPNQSQYFRAGVAGKGHGQGDEVTKRDSPAYTVRANAKSRIQFHYELPRRLTVRECARIQCFPDTFIFPFAATESIMQIGNAVPPVLAHILADQLANFLDQEMKARRIV